MKKWSSQRGSQFPQSHGPQRKESLLIGIKRKIRKSTVVAIGIAPVLVFYCVVTFGQNCKAGERSRNPDLYEAGTAPWLVSHAENHRLREKSKQKMPTQPGKSNEYKNANEARFTQSAAMAGERKQSSEKQIVSQRSLLGKSGMEDDSMMLIVMLKDSESLQRAKAMCGYSKKVSHKLGRKDKCSITGACTHYFDFINGFAGVFTSKQVQLLHSCLDKAILYIEADQQVEKAEHDYKRDKYRSQEQRIKGRRLDESVSLDVHELGGEGANDDPVLWNLSAPLQSASSQIYSAGLQLDYLQVGNGSSVYKQGFKAQQVFPAEWNLDRIDQQQPPLDRQFSFGTPSTAGSGAGVNIYVLDSGIVRSHQEFQSWTDSAVRGFFGYNFVDNSLDASDCDGHGTHISSTAVGRTVGVAKEARVFAVRVLNCQGVGNVSSVVAGLNWVAQNYIKPAVVTLSLGVRDGQWSDALNQAVLSLTQTGITVTVASGNSQTDACQIAPANVREAISVAASDLQAKFEPQFLVVKDITYSWANTGDCVSIFAPGVDILGACGGAGRCPILNNSAYTWASGTSMAVPHVAGLAAVYLSNNPQARPAEVKAALLNSASPNQINFSTNSVLPGTPNLLINSIALQNQGIVTATQGP